jgi:hypothetical protein
MPKVETLYDKVFDKEKHESLLIEIRTIANGDFHKSNLDKLSAISELVLGYDKFALDVLRFQFSKKKK